MGEICYHAPQGKIARTNWTVVTAQVAEQRCWVADTIAHKKSEPYPLY